MTATNHTLQCVWPIVDEEMTRSALIAEARQSLPVLAIQAHATIIGTPTWHIRPAAQVPGWYSHGGSVLVAEVPALPVPRRGIRAADQVPVIAHLADLGWPDQRIAEALGCCRETVLTLRHRHGIPAYKAVAVAA